MAQRQSRRELEAALKDLDGGDEADRVRTWLEEHLADGWRVPCEPSCPSSSTRETSRSAGGRADDRYRSRC